MQKIVGGRPPHSKQAISYFALLAMTHSAVQCVCLTEKVRLSTAGAAAQYICMLWNADIFSPLP